MNNELILFNEREVLGKRFKVYGDVENPLFLAKDVAEWIDHSKVSMMLSSVDEDEKLRETIFTSGQNREMWFLTEDGLYEVLMQSRKPIAKAFKKEIKVILRELRKSGVVILENATKEAVNFKLKYGVYKIRKTFANSESIREDYNEFKELSVTEWKSKRLDNSDRVKLSKLIQKGIQDKINNDFMTMRPSEMLACQELMTDIQTDITKLENKKNGGKLASATKTIKEYKKQIPDADEYVCIEYHPFSVNQMYEQIKDNNGKVYHSKTKSYNTWISKFPKTIIRNNFENIDLTKPTKMWLKFDCMERFDADNLVKSIQDQIVRDLEADNDNNIVEVKYVINKRVDTYKEGKIYILLKNI